MSRQFAFVGFRTEAEAWQCIKHFNKSFIDTSRLQLELAKEKNADDLPRPWSRHTPAKLKSVKEPVPNDDDYKVKTVAEIIEQDPKLREFLEVMKPRSQKKIWENDDLVADSGVVPQTAVTATTEADADYEDLPSGVQQKSEVTTT